MNNDLIKIRDQENKYLKALVAERERVEAERTEKVRYLVEAIRGCIVLGTQDVSAVDLALKELGI